MAETAWPDGAKIARMSRAMIEPPGPVFPCRDAEHLGLDYTRRKEPEVGMLSSLSESIMYVERADPHSRLDRCTAG